MTICFPSGPDTATGVTTDLISPQLCQSVEIGVGGGSGDGGGGRDYGIGGRAAAVLKDILVLVFGVCVCVGGGSCMTWWAPVWCGGQLYDVGVAGWCEDSCTMWGSCMMWGQLYGVGDSCMMWG